MNEIRLKGLLRDIRFSHSLLDTEYYKADLITTRPDGKEDVIDLRFKQFSNPYQEEQVVELQGNIRSYSYRDENNRNRVNIYVFTYFDIPQADEDGYETSNGFELTGRVCKIDPLLKTPQGKEVIHFILANNIISEEKHQKLNNYIPCVAWGNMAKKLANLQVNDMLYVKGELHSRTYKKMLDNGEVEFRTAHECVISQFKMIYEEDDL